MNDAMAILALVLVLGVGAQWAAWRLGIPSILLLLLLGITAGPVTGIVDAGALMGDLLLPVVSLAVALILFEGGLTLRFGELRSVGGVVPRLVTVGALVTLVIVSVAAWLILGLSPELAALLGANLVVTGPTVIGPLLQQVRPKGAVGPVLRWEGIVIDPIGAILAVLVFEAIFVGSFVELTAVALGGFLMIVAVGSAMGFAGAGAIILLIRRYWIPDQLQNAVTLTIVLGVFALSNLLRSEAGLLAVTIMGITVANQRRVPIGHIVEFKENIRVLLLALLFILLGARLRVEHLAYLNAASLAFVAVIMFVARPLAVWTSTIGTSMTWQERLFVAAVAPRGIVAAAIASIFALELAAAGRAEADQLVPYTFLVIIATVTFYGLLARPLARWLGLAEPDPRGVLIVGAHSWARSIAVELQRLGCPVLMVDTNWGNVAAARLDGIPTHFGSIADEEIEQELDLGGIGRLLALTPNEAVNSLACLHFAHIFGRDHVYQVRPGDTFQRVRGRVSPGQRGRVLFASGVDHRGISQRVDSGGRIAALLVTHERAWSDLVDASGRGMLPLLLVRAGGSVVPLTDQDRFAPTAGDTVIAVQGGSVDEEVPGLARRE